LGKDIKKVINKQSARAERAREEAVARGVNPLCNSFFFNNPVT